MSEPKYRYYYSVKTVSEEIYLSADYCTIEASGVICFFSKNDVLLNAFPSGVWIEAHGASCFDGSPVNIDHRYKIKGE